MNMNFLITLGLAFLSFVVPAVCYSVMARKSNFNRKASLTNTAFFAVICGFAAVDAAGLFLPL